MLGQLLGNIMGSWPNQTAAQQGPSTGLLGSSSQQVQAAYNNALSQAASTQQAMMMRNRDWHRWMYDGVSMGTEEFANCVWPDDCAEKTMFLLKHSK